MLSFTVCKGKGGAQSNSQFLLAPSVNPSPISICPRKRAVKTTISCKSMTPQPSNRSPSPLYPAIASPFLSSPFISVFARYQGVNLFESPSLLNSAVMWAHHACPPLSILSEHPRSHVHRTQLSLQRAHVHHAQLSLQRAHNHHTQLCSQRAWVFRKMNTPSSFPSPCFSCPPVSQSTSSPGPYLCCLPSSTPLSCAQWPCVVCRQVSIRPTR